MRLAGASGFLGHVGSDAGGQIGEAAFQPRLEGRNTVVIDQAELGEDLDGAFDAEPVGAQWKPKTHIEMILKAKSAAARVTAVLDQLPPVTSAI